jgi:ribosomal protein L24
MKITLLTLALMITGFSQAQTLADALHACSTKIDNLARLTCFDKLANQPLKVNQAGTVVQTTPKTHAPTVPEIPVVKVEHRQAEVMSPKDQEQEFGLASKTVKTKISKVIATVSQVSKDPHGKLIISLDNQHVWKQNDTQSFRLKAGDSIYVEAGALNSFFLSKESINKRIRVKRIK